MKWHLIQRFYSLGKQSGFMPHPNPSHACCPPSNMVVRRVFDTLITQGSNKAHSHEAREWGNSIFFPSSSPSSEIIEGKDGQGLMGKPVAVL